MNQKRQYFMDKWVKELSKKLQKPEEDLLLEGLMADDFGDTNVFIEHEDGSSSFYMSSFYVENKTEYAVFTEHCDYHEFKKDWLNQIQEEKPVDLDKLVRIQWVGDGNAYIECDDTRIYMNKLQLKDLQRQLTRFINYYGEDFSPKQLHLLKNLTGKNNIHEDDE